MARGPVSNSIKVLQASLAAIVLELGGFSIYSYFNMIGLIADGGILPLVGCGLSVFAVCLYSPC